VSSTRSLLTWGRRRFGRGFGLLAGSKEGKVSESGTLIGVFMARMTWNREARGAERRLRAEKREGLDIGNFLSFSSVFTEGIEIPQNVRVECATKWPF
jgi:hypothetical protein